MKKRSNALLVALAVVAMAGAALAQGMNPMVGGAAMYRNKDIIDNAVNSADHTTLVAAVKAAGLVETLKGKGPFTVFAPTNEAFAKLPNGTVDNLLKPENKGTLTKVLTYHVVAGNYDSKALTKLIKKGHGTGMLKTVSGDKLILTMGGMKGMMANQIMIRDEKGQTANVTIANVRQSNGVIHVIDSVLLPN
ncbi:MAG: fasciclin domain-containing protein [Blastocatellia bacterium]|nr:fasciclin domain-containing protein [Blastocatellia bacterium]